MINAIITDIEGTTSSIAFVKDVLFPYAANAFPRFLAEHWDDADVQQLIAAAAAESGQPLTSPDSANALFQEWIAADRKVTPLKALQGKIDKYCMKFKTYNSFRRFFFFFKCSLNYSCLSLNYFFDFFLVN